MFIYNNEISHTSEKKDNQHSNSDRVQTISRKIRKTKSKSKSDVTKLNKQYLQSLGFKVQKA